MHNLCTVEVVVIGSKPGLRPSDLAEHIPAHIGGFGPELAVLRRSPARPQFIERRQMIGSVRKVRVYVRHKADHVMILIQHRADGLRPRRHVPRGTKERQWFPTFRGFLRLPLVVRTGPGMIGRNKGRIVRMYAERPCRG